MKIMAIILAIAVAMFVGLCWVVVHLWPHMMR
jgi:hypothetical protein